MLQPQLPPVGIGLQYQQRMPDLPDVEMMQFMMQHRQQEEASDMEARLARRPRMAEEIQKKLMDGEFLPGTVQEIMDAYNQATADWEKNYWQGDKMFSPEAMAASSRALEHVGLGNLSKLQAKKQTFDQYGELLEKEGVGTNVYLDGSGRVLASNGEGKVQPMKIGEYFALQQELQKNRQPSSLSLLNEQQAYEYSKGATTLSKDGPSTSVSNTAKFEEVRKNLQETFKELGSNVTVYESYNQGGFAKALAGMGLNHMAIGRMRVAEGNHEQNAAQRAAAGKAFTQSMTEPERRAVAQQMLASGLNPYEEGQVKIGNETYTINRIDAFVGELVNNVSASKAIDKVKQNSSFISWDTGSGSGEGGGNGKHDWRARVIERPGYQMQNGNAVPEEGWSMSQVATGYQRDKTGKLITTPKNAAVQYLQSAEAKKAIIGDTAGRPLADGQPIIIGGQEVQLSVGVGSEQQGDMIPAWNTNKAEKVISVVPEYDENNNKVDHPLTRSTNNAERSLITTKAGLEQMRSRLSQALKRNISMEEFMRLQRIETHDADDLQKVLPGLGFDPTSAEQIHGSQNTWVPGMDEDLYEVYYFQPLTPAWMEQQHTTKPGVDQAWDRNENDQRNQVATEQILRDQFGGNVQKTNSILLD